MKKKITGRIVAALACLMLLGAAPAGRAQAPTTATARIVAPPAPPPPVAAQAATTQSAGRIPAFVRGTATVKAAPVNGNGNGGIMFNFRDVELTTVLDYLSKAAGLVIVRDTAVSGRVDVVSQTPMNREEAVQLLNTVLSTKGYTAILNERTLKIVTVTDARQKDLPVRKGNVPEEVKKTDEMVTQIIPIRYVNSSQLISALQLLLPTYAVISANDSSNALILTATTTDIRRMMEIIAALDTSVAEIGSFKVYQLQYADATELARMLSDLFRETNQAVGSSGGSSRGGFPFPGGGGPMSMMFGGGGPGGDRGGGPGGSSRGSSGSSGSDSARRAAQRVTAVADTRTNSLVVSAPKDMLTSIDELIKQIDSTTEEVCEIRVFPLRYSDATAMSQLINDVFQSQQGGGSSRGGSSRGGSSGISSMIMSRFMGSRGGSSSGGSTDSRSSQETMVLAVAEIRTNSVVVNASKSMMEQIGPMIKELDTDPAKDKKVYVYPLKYADAEQMSIVLQDMFSGTGGRGSSSGRNRSTTGLFGSGSGNFATNRSSSSSRGSGGGGGGSVPSGMNLP